MLGDMAETHPRADQPILDRFGQALRTMFAETAQDPVPERWTDLIKRLDNEERRKLEAHRRV